MPIIFPTIAIINFFIDTDIWVIGENSINHHYLKDKIFKVT